MAKSPDPSVKLTSSKGTTGRSTTGRRCSTSAWWCSRRARKRHGGSRSRDASSECSATPTAAPRTASRATSSSRRPCSATAEDEALTLCDPDGELVASLGLTHLPAFVHLRQDTSLVAAAEGWDPAAWQQVAKDDRQGHELVGARRRRSRRSGPYPRLAGLNHPLSGALTCGNTRVGFFDLRRGCRGG